jgi:diguanylate cyclase (GGDEF)-like protein/PAS domain S-box-containing protein
VHAFKLLYKEGMNPQHIFCRAWTGYVVAVALVAFAAALRIWPLQAIESRLAWLTFYPAVTVVAIYGGGFIGLLATVLACLTVTFLWPILVAEPFIKNPADWLGMSVFILTCTLISGVAEAMRRAQARAIEALAQAEAANSILKQTEQILSQYAAIIESSDDAIVGSTLEGIITSWNGGAERVFGYSREEVQGRPISLLIPEQYQHEEATLMERIRSGIFVKHYETVRRCKDGKLIDISLTLSPLRDQYGNVVGASKIARNITERKMAEEKIHNLAFYDTLTQLPNRRMLNDRLGQAMAANKRSGIYGAVMFMDLDNFKPLNDTHGHIVGDLLLIEVAHRITRCVREMDTVARFGGDEFVVMLSELNVDRAKSKIEAGIVAEKIRNTLAEPYALTIQPDGDAKTTVEHHCTSSIGVVLFINHEASPDNLFKWADIAMYQAKDGGRNLIRFYDAKD